MLSRLVIKIVVTVFESWFQVLSLSQLDYSQPVSFSLSLSFSFDLHTRFAPRQPLPAFQLIRSTSFRHYIISFSQLSRYALECRLPVRSFARKRVFGIELCHTMSCHPSHCARDSKSYPWDFRGKTILFIIKSYE